MISDYSTTDLTSVGRNSTQSLRLRYGRTMRKNYPRILQVLIFPYTINSYPGCTAVLRAERNPGKKLNLMSQELASASKLMRNALAKFLSCKIHHCTTLISDVIISISTRVSLQWFKLNRKKSETKLIHCLCICIISQRRASVCLPYRDYCDSQSASQTKIARKQIASS